MTSPVDGSFVAVNLLFVVCGVRVLILAAEIGRKDIANRWDAGVIALVWGSAVVWMTATRPVHVPSDMSFYLDRFDDISEQAFTQVIRGDENDPGFSVLLWGIRQFSTAPDAFKIVAAGLITVLVWIALRKLLDPVQACIAFYVTTIFPFFVYYVTNTVRQGIAIAVLLVALGVVASRRGRTLYLVLLLLVAVGVHLSAVVPALILLVFRFRRVSVRVSVMVWVISAATFVSGINQRLLAPLVGEDERLTRYAESSVIGSYEGGVNRLDFLAVSMLLIGMALFLTRNGVANEYTEDQRTTLGVLVPVLILTNAYFLCLGFIAYSDRLAAYSWLLAPMVLGYITLNREGPARGRVAVTYVASSVALCIVMQGWPDLLERTPITG